MASGIGGATNRANNHTTREPSALLEPVGASTRNRHTYNTCQCNERQSTQEQSHNQVDAQRPTPKYIQYRLHTRTYPPMHTRTPAGKRRPPEGLVEDVLARRVQGGLARTASVEADAALAGVIRVAECVADLLHGLCMGITPESSSAAGVPLGGRTKANFARIGPTSTKLAMRRPTACGQRVDPTSTMFGQFRPPNLADIGRILADVAQNVGGCDTSTNVGGQCRVGRRIGRSWADVGQLWAELDPLQASFGATWAEGIGPRFANSGPEPYSLRGPESWPWRIRQELRSCPNAAEQMSQRCSLRQEPVHGRRILADFGHVLASLSRCGPSLINCNSAHTSDLLANAEQQLTPID